MRAAAAALTAVVAQVFFLDLANRSGKKASRETLK
jgi:hypothetical protein